MLVLSTDLVVASLLGLLLESQGYAPRFPAPEESPELALASALPTAVVIDCDHRFACTEEYIAAVRATGAVPVLFSPGRRDYEVRDVAKRHGLAWFALPVDRRELARKLASALAT